MCTAKGSSTRATTATIMRDWLSHCECYIAHHTLLTTPQAGPAGTMLHFAQLHRPHSFVLCDFDLQFLEGRNVLSAHGHPELAEELIAMHMDCCDVHGCVALDRTPVLSAFRD